MSREGTTQEGRLLTLKHSGRPGYLPALAHLAVYVAFLSLLFTESIILNKTFCFHFLIENNPMIYQFYDTKKAEDSVKSSAIIDWRP